MCVVPTHDTIFRCHNRPFGSVQRNGDQQGKKQSKHQVGSRNACESFPKRQSEKRSKRVCRGWQSGPAGPAGRPAGASSQPGHFTPDVFPTAAPPEHDLGGCSHSCVSGGKRSDMGEYGGGTGRCTDPPRVVWVDNDHQTGQNRRPRMCRSGCVVMVLVVK